MSLELATLELVYDVRWFAAAHIAHSTFQAIRRTRRLITWTDLAKCCADMPGRTEKVKTILRVTTNRRKCPGCATGR